MGNNYFPVSGGQEADIEDHLWTVAICGGNQGPASDFIGCGGAIGPRWILTGAHVVEGLVDADGEVIPDNGYIVVGQTDLDIPNTVDEATYRFEIDRIITYQGNPTGNATNDNYDLALVRVTRDLPEIIRFGGPETFDEEIAERDHVRFAGWGRLENAQRTTVLHRGDNEITRITDEYIYFNPFNLQTGVRMGMTEYGDSGTPIYLPEEETGYDQPVLVALATRYNFTGEEALRIDNQLYQWIENITGIAPLTPDDLPDTDTESDDDDTSPANDTEPEAEDPVAQELYRQVIELAAAIDIAAVANLAIGIDNARPNANQNQAHIEPPGDEEEVPLIDNPQQNGPDRDGLRRRRRVRQAKDVEILDSNCTDKGL